MKTKISFFLFLIIVGCSKKTVNLETDLIYSEGVYLNKSYKPYSGSAFFLYENGNTAFEGTIKNGRLEGIVTFWSEDGHKEMLGTYIDGELYSSVFFNIDGSLKNGKFIDRYENGNKKFEVHYVDGKIEGLHKQWFENGNKKSVDVYMNGKFNGSVTNWYENGKKRLESSYKDGKKNGLVTDWYVNGKKRSEVFFKDGLKDGEEKFWFESGNILSLWPYKDGKVDGITTEWWENGIKKIEKTYNNGKLNGSVTNWYENGKERIEASFQNGNEISIKKWNEDGTVLTND